MISETVSVTSSASQHQGVQRMQSGLSALRETLRSLTGSKSVAAAFLGAAVATLVVLADRMIDSWADEHLMAAWVLMWALVFFTVGLFSGAARVLAKRAVAVAGNWAATQAQARADERLWAYAKHDPRVMAELRIAQVRGRTDISDDERREAMQQIISNADSARGANVNDEIEAANRRRGFVVRAHMYL